MIFLVSVHRRRQLGYRPSSGAEGKASSCQRQWHCSSGWEIQAKLVFFQSKIFYLLHLLVASWKLKMKSILSKSATIVKNTEDNFQVIIKGHLKMTLMSNQYKWLIEDINFLFIVVYAGCENWNVQWRSKMILQKKLLANIV